MVKSHFVGYFQFCHFVVKVPLCEKTCHLTVVNLLLIIWIMLYTQIQHLSQIALLNFTMMTQRLDFGQPRLWSRKFSGFGIIIEPPLQVRIMIILEERAHWFYDSMWSSATLFNGSLYSHNGQLGMRKFDQSNGGEWFSGSLIGQI